MSSSNMPARQPEDDRHLLAHIQDLARRGAPAFTTFLDRRQYALATSGRSPDGFTFFGGYPEAVRGILCLHPPGEAPAPEDFPLVCVTYTFSSRQEISHRDVLGGLMGSRLRRDMVGDIVVTAGRAQCFLTREAASAAFTIERLGKVRVTAADDVPFANDFVQEFKLIRGTVASPRLDAVLRCALSESREASAARIRRGEVMLNDLPCERAEKLLSPGDVFSVRGAGKFRLKSAEGLSRKGRVPVEIEKFL